MIVILYAVIGVLAALGAITTVRKILAPKGEQVFYAMFLIMVAGFYLAFVAYFGASAAWRLETAVVAVFAAIALLGARLPSVLIVGYSLHGLWDLLHELQAHTAHSALEPGRLTSIPLAYGFFCLAFDVSVALYFVGRRAQWVAAWQARPLPASQEK